MKNEQTKCAGWLVLSLLAIAGFGGRLRSLAQEPLPPAPKAEVPNAVRSLNVQSVHLISPDGKTAVGIWNIPDGGGHMAVYDMATGKTRFHADSNGGLGGLYIEGAVFAPDSLSFVTGWGGNSVRVWDATTGDIIAKFDLKQQQWGRPLAISPDGKILVSGDYNGKVQLWNLATGQALRSFRGHTASLWGAAFSPDGKTLATCSEDRTARLWNVATGQLRFALQGHQDKVYCLAFSHDGKTLATGSADQQIKLWETKTGFAQRTLTGHKGIVFSLAFSTNDEWLASGGLDETARLWEIHNGRLAQTFNAGSRGVPTIAFLEGDTHLAVASEDTLGLLPIALSKLH